MNILHTIKNTIGNYFLSGEVKGVHRNKMFVNMQDAKTVGIIFDASDKDNFELVKKYISYLREMKKRTKAIGYYNQKAVPAIASKLEYDFFCQKDLTWYNSPNSIYVKNFIQEEYDILLDLNLNNLFPLRYVSAMSKAKFKVGKKSDINNSIFDLMIDAKEETGMKYFLRNMDTYLFVINRKNNESITSDE